MAIALKHLRQHVVELIPPAKYDVDTFVHAVGPYPDSKPAGVDNWGIKELKIIAPECAKVVSASLQSTLTLNSQPHQNLLNKHPLLGKASGGERTICITPTYCRALLRGNGEVFDWEAEYTGPFDQAGKNKSALFAAVLRSLFAEVHAWTDEEVVAAFNDFNKFF